MDMLQRAVAFAKAEILQSCDWQEVEHALANHTEFGPWLLASSEDALGAAQTVIRSAERELGDNIPDGYAN